MTEFRVERPIWNDCVDIYARTESDGKPAALVADGIKIVPVTREKPWPRFISLPLFMADAQSLFDALWQAGFRPNNGESSQAHVNAMNAHLQDMRKLVFREETK